MIPTKDRVSIIRPKIAKASILKRISKQFKNLKRRFIIITSTKFVKNYNCFEKQKTSILINQHT